MIESAKIREAMASFLKLPVDELTDDKPLKELVAQSFLLVELVIELQEEFKVRFGQEQLKDVQTVKDLEGLIQKTSEKG